MSENASEQKVSAKTQSSSVPMPKPQATPVQQDETVLMAMNLYAEARGESTLGRYAVANVVRNRVNSSAFPGSFKDVITQRLQFSWTRTSDPNYEEARNPSNKDIWAECVKIAKEVMAGSGRNPVAGADHYHTSGVAPGWSKGKSPVARVGVHLFFDLHSDDNAAALASSARGQLSDSVGNIAFERPARYTKAPALADIEKQGSKAVLHLGHQGPAVEALQEMLELDPDGYFGVGTAQAVVRFKQEHHLGQAERVGYYTLLALRRSKQESVAPDTSPRPVARPDRAVALDGSLAELVDGGGVLKIGSRGEVVRALQRQLNTIGFETMVDGDYGPGTRNSVELLQRESGLGADGVFGKGTAEALTERLKKGSHIDTTIDQAATSDDGFADMEASKEKEDDNEAGANNKTNADTTNDSVTIDDNFIGPLRPEDKPTEILAVNEIEPSVEWKQVMAGELALRQGMRGNVVKELQHRLIDAGQEVGTDGVFGNGTKTAVMNVQMAHGSTPDGVVGKSTAAALSQATAWKNVLDACMVLRRGMKGPVVKHMQALLTRAGFGVASTGEFGAFTQRQVLAFQEANLIEKTGKMGATTAAMLEEKAKGSASDSFIWPVRGGAYFTSPYGPRNVRGGSKYHKGIDIQSASKAGQIIAAASGVVTTAAYGPNGGYGNYIDIKHEIAGRTFYTRYAHLSSINVVNNQNVTQAQHIGQEGGSGNKGARSYPVHLHFEVHEDSLNNKVDPLKHVKVPGDVSIQFGNSSARLAKYGNFERDDDVSMWSF